MVIFVHADGCRTIDLSSLWPTHLFPFTDHPVVLHNRVVTIYDTSPVLLKTPIHHLDFREGGVNRIKAEKCPIGRVDVRVVAIFVIPHISCALEEIYTLIHTGIDRGLQAEFIAPSSCGSRFTAMGGSGKESKGMNLRVNSKDNDFMIADLGSHFWIELSKI